MRLIISPLFLAFPCFTTHAHTHTCINLSCWDIRVFFTFMQVVCCWPCTLQRLSGSLFTPFSLSSGVVGVVWSVTCLWWRISFRCIFFCLSLCVCTLDDSNRFRTTSDNSGHLRTTQNRSDPGRLWLGTTPDDSDSERLRTTPTPDDSDSEKLRKTPDDSG